MEADETLMLSLAAGWATLSCSNPTEIDDMHIPIPIFDPTVPMSVNLFHAAAVSRIWTDVRGDLYAEHVDRLIASGVVLAKQPYVDPPRLTDPPQWMLDLEDDDYLAREPCPDKYGWGPVDEKPPAADEDDEVEITEEDEPCLRGIDEEAA